MPIYEYECSSCMNVIEVWQSVAEDPMTTCPACSGSLKKIISMSSFHLKGNGWYADGYSAANAGNQAKACGASDGAKAACSAAGDGKTACGAASGDSSSCAAAKTGGEADVKKKTDSPAPVASTPCSSC